MISIHAPRAGRDRTERLPAPSEGISIHAPRAGRDKHLHDVMRYDAEFQSTRPVRGAT